MLANARVVPTLAVSDIVQPAVAMARASGSRAHLTDRRGGSDHARSASGAGGTLSERLDVRARRGRRGKGP